MVQEMITSTISAFRIQGKNFQLPPSWFVDSSASNLMTSSIDMLYGIRKYEDAQYI